MQQFRNVLLAVAALVFAASVSVVGEVSRESARSTPQVASSTLTTVSNPVPAGMAAAPPERPSSVASSTPPATTPKTISPSVPAPLPEPVKPIVQATSSTQVAAPQAAASGTLLERSLVNIICTSQDSSLRSISGSGVVVDSRGLIMTAAHIAQYFLLTDYPKAGGSECVIRTGSPAKDAYQAKLVYIPPDWVRENAKTLSQNSPSGTGENDFAILAVTKSATGAALPTSFSYLPLSKATPKTGDSINISSYGAEFLSSKQIRRSLYPTIASATIHERYTFKENTVDLIALGGSIAAQEGSSGGAAVNAAGEVAGIITTSTIVDELAERNLNAVTLGHVRRSFKADTDEDLEPYLANHSPSWLIEAFASEAAHLSEIVIKAIN